uniref:Uncharacterized protein n=1 Tax=Rangifer tarandus platyrhynchus TaxID=3082113 RepID=A0ACB0ENY5_RANTA|nr:unnamed protein product [Rangifer tarandus platyrhynchus]
MQSEVLQGQREGAEMRSDGHLLGCDKFTLHDSDLRLCLQPREGLRRSRRLHAHLNAVELRLRHVGPHGNRTHPPSFQKTTG